jgi:signal transduction histidine kinase
MTIPSMTHLQAFTSRWRIWFVLAIVLLLMGTLGMAFFSRSRAIMEEQLKTNLRNTAAAAAMQFDGAQLEQIHDVKDMESPVFKEIADRLIFLRSKVPDIRFAYILRRTNSPHTLEFVVDADAVLSPSELDLDGNGAVDPDEEPSYPGDRYDIHEVPALQLDAFQHPSTDEEITYDQWGALISGYAPIRRKDNGKVVAVLGIDMLARDYLQSSYSIFSPGALFLVLLAIVCLTAGFVLLLISKQVENLRQMNAERTGLLQLTFHQLGEPLTIFKWSLETIKERRPGESLEKLIPDHIKNMETGIERMSGIIDDLRGAEQVELRTLAYHPQRSSVSELLSEISQDTQPFLAHRKQKLEVICENKLWCSFDPQWIKQVLHALLENAMNYSPESSLITLKAAYKRNHVVVQVMDRGAGIPAKDLPHIFEKFRRGSNAGIYTPAGTGLSLYTAKGIIGMAGGKMTVESAEGKGTIVSFTLPVT